MWLLWCQITAVEYPFQDIYITLHILGAKIERSFGVSCSSWRENLNKPANKCKVQRNSPTVLMLLGSYLHETSSNTTLKLRSLIFIFQCSLPLSQKRRITKEEVKIQNAMMDVEEQTENIWNASPPKQDIVLLHSGCTKILFISNRTISLCSKNLTSGRLQLLFGEHELWWPYVCCIAV